MTKEELQEEFRRFQGAGFVDGAKERHLLEMICLLLLEIKMKLDTAVNINGRTITEYEEGPGDWDESIFGD